MSRGSSFSRAKNERVARVWPKVQAEMKGGASKNRGAEGFRVCVCAAAAAAACKNVCVGVCVWWGGKVFEESARGTVGERSCGVSMVDFISTRSS